MEKDSIPAANGGGSTISSTAASAPLTAHSDDEVSSSASSSLSSSSSVDSLSADDSWGADSPHNGTRPKRTVSAPEITPSSATLTPFDGTAGGHSDFFSVGSGRLAKPCNPHEAFIYELLWQHHVEPALLKFVPRFFGRLHSDSPVLGRREAQLEHTYIVIQNVNDSFRCPSIIDLKLGQRQYPSNSDSKFVRRREAKCAATTSAELGLRLGGTRIYRPISKEYIVTDKRQGKLLTNRGFRRTFRQFLFDGHRTRFELVPLFLRQLRALLVALQSQHSFVFVASSLLMSYDGDYNAVSSSAAGSREQHVVVSLIDFDHTEIVAGSLADTVATQIDAAAPSTVSPSDTLTSLTSSLSEGSLSSAHSSPPAPSPTRPPVRRGSHIVNVKPSDDGGVLHGVKYVIHLLERLRDRRSRRSNSLTLLPSALADLEVEHREAELSVLHVERSMSFTSVNTLNTTMHANGLLPPP